MKIFVSYSHRDSDWISDNGKYKLISWIKEMLNEDADIWTDQYLYTGDDFSKVIEKQISEANLVILLISQNFAKPGYIHNVELPLIKRMYDDNKLSIIPLLLTRLTSLARNRFDWIFDLQTYPNDKKPLIDLAADHCVWEDAKIDILEGIENKISSYNAKINENSIYNSIKQETKPVYSDEVTISADACFEKGEYFDADGDYQKAFYWFSNAARKGHTYAMEKIGNFYEDGKGVLINEKQAVKWYKKAIETEQRNAQENDEKKNVDFLFLGKEYYKKEEYSLALGYFKLAIKENNNEAMYFMAIMYEMGYGVKKDINTSIEWYKKSAALGNDSANHYLKMNEI